MEYQKVQFDPGAVVEASDGRVGTVDEVVVRPETGELVYLVVRRGWSDERLVLAAEMVEQAQATDRMRVRLRVTRDEALRRGRDVPKEALVARADGDTLRIPIAEERLRAGTRAVDHGELRIHRSVIAREESIQQSLTRDDVSVERVTIDRFVDAPPAVRTEGDILIVPVLEEVLVVEKRLKLKEELRISTRQVVEQQEVRELVRSERVELEDSTARGVKIVDQGIEATANPAPATPITRKSTRYGDLAKGGTPTQTGATGDRTGKAKRSTGTGSGRKG